METSAWPVENVCFKVFMSFGQVKYASFLRFYPEDRPLKLHCTSLGYWWSIVTRSFNSFWDVENDVENISKFHTFAGQYQTDIRMIHVTYIFPPYGGCKYFQNSLLKTILKDCINSKRSNKTLFSCIFNKILALKNISGLCMFWK